MKKQLNRIGATLSLIIGMMAVFSGGKVLLGEIPDYYVIDWVPVYNFAAGLIAALVTSLLLWRNSKVALPAAVITLGSHSTVMLILQTAYRDVVASESIRAMTIRIITWTIIVSLLLVQAWINRTDRRGAIQVPGRG